MNSEAKQKCERLEITYGDSLTTKPTWANVAANGTGTGTGCTIPTS